MVKYLIFLFLVLSSSTFSAEFTASVDRTTIPLNESITLNLTLKDSSPKGTPSIDVLESLFTIHSQQKSHHTTILNGQMTSNNHWKLVLIPKNEGEVTIPSITIDTNSGVLSSQPITIHVTKRDSNKSSESTDNHALNLSAEASLSKPYKNESFTYTVKLTSEQNLANIQIQKISVEETIIETIGEPKVYQQVINGVNRVIVEFNYLITPLKAGSLKIPPTLIQGQIVTSRKPSSSSLFDDDFTHFSAMFGLSQLQPFAIKTGETFLDVQPVVADVTPWLPAKSLKIEESWDDSQLFREGEPFHRGITIVAEGVKSSQLPNLGDMQTGQYAFKSYADKPELRDEIKEGSVIGYRKEQYTLIPQESGALVLPEISIVWWDVVKKERVISHLPSRTVQILPAPENRAKNEVALGDQPSLMASKTEVEVIKRDPILYVLIIGLAILLVAAMAWGIILQKKIKQITGTPSIPAVPLAPSILPVVKVETPKKNKNEKLPDLNPT
jgi:hypothetical protein